LSDGSIFSWNFGHKNNTSKQIEEIREQITLENKNSKRNFIKDKKLNYYIMENYESSRYKISIVDYNNPEFRHVFFDKKTNESVVFDKTVENVQFLIPHFSGESIILSEQSFKYTFYNESCLSEAQKKIIRLHNEYDNPFIIKYNLKR
jgi:hypothetical protein